MIFDQADSEIEFSFSLDFLDMMTSNMSNTRTIGLDSSKTSVRVAPFIPAVNGNNTSNGEIVAILADNFDSVEQNNENNEH